MKLLHIFFILNMFASNLTNTYPSEGFALLHTPLLGAISDFIDAAATYHRKTKHFEDSYYNAVFYITAAAITARHFYKNKYSIKSLPFGSFTGAVGGILATYCTWPFYPLVSLAVRNVHIFYIREKVTCIKHIIDITDNIAILNAAQKSLPTYTEGTWIHEQKMHIYNRITLRIQELRQHALHQGNIHE